MSIPTNPQPDPAITANGETPCVRALTVGMIVARSCSLTAVAWAWVPILKEKFYTLRERLRDLYREAPAKAGDKRCELDLGTCWAPWLSWVVEGWHSKQLALALDATTLGNASRCWR